MIDLIKWQPVVMVMNKRLECQCGALGIFVCGTQPENEKYNVLEDVDIFCQSCFVKMQEEEDA
jgi:hypothetical protein